MRFGRWILNPKPRTLNLKPEALNLFNPHRQNVNFTQHDLHGRSVPRQIAPRTPISHCLTPPSARTAAVAFLGASAHRTLHLIFSPQDSRMANSPNMTSTDALCRISTLRESTYHAATHFRLHSHLPCRSSARLLTERSNTFPCLKRQEARKLPSVLSAWSACITNHPRTHFEAVQVSFQRNPPHTSRNAPLQMEFVNQWWGYLTIKS